MEVDEQPAAKVPRFVFPTLTEEMRTKLSAQGKRNRKHLMVY